MRDTVSVGGQSYRGVDTGRANVLVPIDDLSPAQRNARNEAVARALFLTERPFAGAAYGVASLLNASPTSRDIAIAGGATADALFGFAAPRSFARPAMVRPAKTQPVTPGLERDAIRFGQLNTNRQATGATATVTKPMLGTGTRVNQRLTPPGWLGDGRRYGQARAHLLAAQLCGPGRKEEQVFTANQNPTNVPHMSTFENRVARRVRAGEVIEYAVQPMYHGSQTGAPSAILMTATGSRGAPAARLVRNPAGYRR